jgi:hypothetical protein
MNEPMCLGENTWATMTAKPGRGQLRVGSQYSIVNQIPMFLFVKAFIFVHRQERQVNQRRSSSVKHYDNGAALLKSGTRFHEFKVNSET